MAVLFSDGFESGDLTAWTGGGVDTGTATVETGHPHHGLYNALYALTGGSWYSYSHVNFSGGTDTYARGYVQFSALPSTDGLYATCIWLQALNDGTAYGRIIVYNNGGTVVWGMRNYLGGEQINYLSSTTPQINTYYCAEIYCHQGSTINDGVFTLWINGIQLLNITGIDTRACDIDNLAIGDYLLTEAHTVYIDCVVVADTYIGPEIASSHIASSRLMMGIGW